MKNKTLKTLIGTGALFALASCGGGGSAGDASTVKKTVKAGTSNYTNVTNIDPTEMKGEKQGTSVLQHDVNGDRIKETSVDGIDGPIDFTYEVNGKLLTDAQYRNREYLSQTVDIGDVFAGYFVYNGHNGPSAIYWAGDEVTDAESEPGWDIYAQRVEVNPADRDVRFDSVRYKYALSDGNNRWDTTQGADGVIRYNPNNGGWEADLGTKVKLRGQLDGIKVSGAAQYENLVGTFEGNDAYAVRNEDKVKYHYTAGGFAGSDGQKTFAGGWAQSDDPLLGQNEFTDNDD